MTIKPFVVTLGRSKGCLSILLSHSQAFEVFKGAAHRASRSNSRASRKLKGIAPPQNPSWEKGLISRRYVGVTFA